MSFRDKLRSLFGGRGGGLTADFFDALTDTLIEGDLGAKTAYDIMEALQKHCREEKLAGESAVIAALGDFLNRCLVSAAPVPEAGKVNLYLLLGVNGVGKTTTAAKLAHFYRSTRPDLPLVLAAADTFRAAAIDQLKIHGERLGVRVVAQQQGGDPGAVVFDAASALQAGGGGLALIDTAGRLHNKENLVRELQKIDRIAESKASPGCYKKLLVLDATTGQNALRQAEVFHEAIGVDYVVMTKADSSAKGGVAFSLGLPIAFVCTGEGYGDIGLFDAPAYTQGYLGQGKSI